VTLMTTATMTTCPGTLVLHADGSAECEHERTCALEDLEHELWVACDELGCGCVGDEQPLPLAA
jgi:hypothetical protein